MPLLALPQEGWWYPVFKGYSKPLQGTLLTKQYIGTCQGFCMLLTCPHIASGFEHDSLILVTYSKAKCLFSSECNCSDSFISVDEQTPSSRQPVGIAKYTVNIQQFMPMLQPFELVSRILSVVPQVYPEQELHSSQRATSANKKKDLGHTSKLSSL